jgi:hypothetical protein
MPHGHSQFKDNYIMLQRESASDFFIFIKAAVILLQRLISTKNYQKIKKRPDNQDAL